MSPDKLDLNILAIPGTLLPDVPSSSLKLGTESNSDLFSCYLKMARSSGTTSAKLQRYLDQPPLAVYRVRPQQKVELTTFPPPKLVFPSKNATENSLISGFVMLEKAVVENLEHGGYVASKNWFTLPGSSLYGKQWAGASRHVALRLCPDIFIQIYSFRDIQRYSNQRYPDTDE